MAKRKITKVFINCPFDSDYSNLIRPILFTLLYLGFEPLIASHRKDSGELRLKKIVNLISEADLSIHDISRVQANSPGEFYRLNMPFELGIDWGHREFINKNKRFLVLAENSYLAARALSDIAGCDPESHNNEPEEVVRTVRNWLASMDFEIPDGASYIWGEYNDFLFDLYELKNHSNEDIKRMPMAEFTKQIKKWTAK